MEEAMSNTVELRRRVASAARGELNEDEKKALADEIVGAFQSFPVIGRGIVSLANRQEWNALIGALGNYIDTQRIGVASTNITNSSVSQATATASVDISVMLDVQQAISSSTELSADQKEQMSAILRELVSAAQKNEAKTVAQRLKDWLEVGANTSTVAQVIGPLLLQIGTMLAS